VTRVARDGFRADIQGLRALAILLVVAVHAGISRVTGGFVGVDVFFVISGFLITSQLRAELARTGTIDFPAFLARRVRRLLPASAFVLVSTVVLAGLVLSPLQLESVATTARAAGAYVSNLHFRAIASDYFIGDVKKDPLLHTWSLSVEEQFYVAWPLILWLAGRSAARSLENRRRVAWTLTAVAMTSFVAACWAVDENRLLAFYGSPLRAWEFACGGLASLVDRSAVVDARRPIVRYALAAGEWIALALVIGAATLYSATTDFPGASALIPVGGTALLLILGPLNAHSRWGVAPLLSSSPMQWLGARSYSWYLWHWPILVLATTMFPELGMLSRIGIVALTLALSDLSYRHVESRFRQSRTDASRHPRATWKTIRFGAATTMAVIGVSEITRRAATIAANNPEYVAYTTAASDLAILYRDGCVNTSNDDRVRVCSYGTQTAPAKTIVLFGDSHAVQWFPALEAIAQARHWQLLVIAKSRCATADVVVYEVNSDAVSTPCERWRRAALDTIVRRRPSFVVLSNASVYVDWPTRGRGIPAVSPDAWRAGISHTLRTFEARAIPTVTIHDTPWLRANVPSCLARSGWFGHRAGMCATDRTLAFNAAVSQAELAAAAGVHASYRVDLSDRLCSDTDCAPTVNKIIAYSDNEHLSATMARAFAPALGRAIDSLGLDRPRSATSDSEAPSGRQ